MTRIPFALLALLALSLTLGACSLDPDAHPTAPVDALNRGEASSVLRYLIDPEAENARNQARIDAILAYESAENEHEARLAAAKAERDARVAAAWATALRGLGIALVAGAVAWLVLPRLIDGLAAVFAARAARPVVNNYNTLHLSMEPPRILLPGSSEFDAACQDLGAQWAGGMWLLEEKPIAYLTVSDDDDDGIR